MEATAEEKQGAKMIIYLQSTMGIVETEEQAIQGWRGMSEAERGSTKATYELFHGEDEKVEGK